MKPVLPHWAQLAAGALTVLVAWAMQHQASGDLSLPAAAVSILAVASVMLGWLSPSATSPAPVAASRGFVSAGLAATLTVLGFCAALFLSGCTAAQGQTAVSALGPGITFAGCAWETYENLPPGTPLVSVIAAEVQACGGDAVSVVTVLDQRESPAMHAHVAHEAPAAK